MAVWLGLSNSIASVCRVTSSPTARFSLPISADGVSLPVETSRALRSVIPIWAPRLSLMTAEICLTRGA